MGLKSDTAHPSTLRQAAQHSSLLATDTFLKSLPSMPVSDFHVQFLLVGVGGDGAGGGNNGSPQTLLMVQSQPTGHTIPPRFETSVFCQ